MDFGRHPIWVPIGRFELAGTTDIGWEAWAILVPCGAWDGPPADHRVPCLVVAPCLHYSLPQNWLPEAAERFKASPEEVHWSDLDGREGGGSIDGFSSGSVDFQECAANAKRILDMVAELVLDGDVDPLRRGLQRIRDLHPWCLLVPRVGAPIAQTAGVDPGKHIEDAALEILRTPSLFHKTSVRGGRPRQSKTRPSKGLALHKDLGALRKRGGTGVSRRMAAAARYDVAQPNSAQMKETRDALRSEERHYRELGIVPVLIPFQDEAFTAAQFLPCVTEAAIKEFQEWGPGSQGAPLEVLGFHEGLVQWVQQPFMETRLRVLCADNWESFRSAGLPPSVTGGDPRTPDWLASRCVEKTGLEE